MAKKKKEDIDKDENINQESQQDDLNEADDSFGLPDVDYEPINRDDDSDELEEESSSTEETASEESEESTDEVYASASSGGEEPPKKEYVPGSYTPPKDDSMVGKVIALILVLLLAGAAIWYFGFYRPEQQRMEKAKIEKQKQEEAEQQRQAEQEAERRRQEELAAQRAAEEKAAAEQKPKEGTIESVPQRTGRYYVVVSSSIDNDLAMDYAEKLKKQGVGTYILLPAGTNKFTRVAVSSHDTWANAATAAEDAKSEFGENVWVIKF